MMQYFTPSLFEELNSDNMGTAFAATEKWTEARRKYQASLAKWIQDAPSEIRVLATKFCGHDARFMQSWSGGTSFCMVVATESHLWTLSYQILSEPALDLSASQHPCWSDRQSRLWLYDEVSKISDGHYRHEILASDGSIFQIDFSDVQLESAHIKHDSSNQQKFDLKIEISLTSRELITAFQRVTLRPSKTSPAHKHAKHTKKSKIPKLSAPHSTKKKADSV